MSVKATTVTLGVACPPDCEAVGVVTSQRAPSTNSDTSAFFAAPLPPDNFDKPMAIKTTKTRLAPNTPNIVFQFSILRPNFFAGRHINPLDRRCRTTLGRQ